MGIIAYDILPHMPELPEVQTTVDGINTLVKNKVISDIWTDLNNSSARFGDCIKNPKFFTQFKNRLIGKKIIGASRRAKNILIDVIDGKDKETILIHMKMTGHIMYGSYMYDAEKNHWYPKAGQIALEDPFNRFLHLVITFTNGKQLVLSDVRKFAKVTLVESYTKEFSHLGPEPLEKEFTSAVFLKQITRFPNKSIKTSLMDQRLISGIGNIYSDEILHVARVLPNHSVKNVSDEQLSAIYKHIKPVLSKGVKFGGDSTSDYRNIYGERGKFQGKHAVYRRTGQKCARKGCGGIILRKVINGRSAHYCPLCQK